MTVPDGASPLIEMRGVTKVIEGVVPVTLVKEIDLVIQPGEFVAITGPSGSGKSSLLYLLGLLDLPTQARCSCKGKPPAASTRRARARARLSLLGFVFQFHFLLPEFSALDNVLLPMRALGALDAAGDARARFRACSPRSASRSMRTSCRSRCRAGSASALRSRAHSRTALR